MFPVEVVHESNPSTRYRSLSLEYFCESVVCLQQQCCTICSCGTRYCNLVKDFFIGFVMYAIVEGSGPTVSIPVLCNSVDEAPWKTLQSQLSSMSAANCSSFFVCLSDRFMVRCRCHCFVLGALSCFTFVYRPAPSCLHAQKQSSISRDLFKITPVLLCVNLAVSIMLFSCRGGTPVHSII